MKSYFTIACYRVQCPTGVCGSNGCNYAPSGSGSRDGRGQCHMYLCGWKTPEQLLRRRSPSFGYLPCLKSD
ncbi:hypothetical protein DPMN_150183 [Dreissena polymorpha]|uniref:Uncharacterized protein n=1 Tax=Dreissena polymorpha TaxID=45954 RepID=A0A9D4FCU7_DREPO|nr:hypothetical protein DPMN_150183 [Dreissena polymorpha]